jgi:hypothetical protein
MFLDIVFQLRREIVLNTSAMVQNVSLQCLDQLRLNVGHGKNILCSNGMTAPLRRRRVKTATTTTTVGKKKTRASVPEDVRALPRQTPTEATSTLRRLARSKPVWYGIVMLAMAGASVVAVRRSMTEAQLRGLGEATIKALRRLGLKLRIPAIRRAHLKELGDALADKVALGEMSGVNAMREYANSFTLADDKDMVRRLLEGLSIKVDGKIKSFWTV